MEVLKLILEDWSRLTAEYEQYINDIKEYSNADDDKVEELKDVITTYIQRIGGTATGALSYVCGQLQKGESLNTIIRKLREEAYTMNSLRNDAYSALANCTLNDIWVTSSSSKGKSRRIKDVNILVPNKVVEVTFADGTKEKAVCREPDVFSLETAIAICISKKIMGGSSIYNNAVKRGVKVYEDKLKEAERAKAEEERIAKKRAKRLEYKKSKEAKRKAQEREEKIEIQKEAYKRAIEEMNTVAR